MIKYIEMYIYIYIDVYMKNIPDLCLNKALTGVGLPLCTKFKVSVQSTRGKLMLRRAATCTHFTLTFYSLE